MAFETTDKLIEVEKKRLKGLSSRVIKTKEYVVIAKDMASGPVRENLYLYKIGLFVRIA